MEEQPTAVADLDDEGGERRGTKPKKPPTGEELRDIKDAADLYRSSSFKLQVRRASLKIFHLTQLRLRSTPCSLTFARNTNVSLRWTAFC